MIETKTSRAEIRMHAFALNARAWCMYTGMYVSIVLVLDSQIFRTRASFFRKRFMIWVCKKLEENSSDCCILTSSGVQDLIAQF